MSVDFQINSDSAQYYVGVLLSASFEFEKNVVNISITLHMKKKENKKTEKKFQQLSAKSVNLKKVKELLASAIENNEYQNLYVKRNETVEKE